MNTKTDKSAKENQSSATNSDTLKKAAALGIVAFAEPLLRFRSAPPAIVSKRAASAMCEGSQAMVVLLRNAILEAASNGKVDVEVACGDASKAISAAVKDFDDDAVPEPFGNLIDAATITGIVIPVLRASLAAWNRQLTR